MKYFIHTILIAGLLLSASASYSNETNTFSEEIFLRVEKMPEFQGQSAQKGFLKWVLENSDYPYEAIMDRAEGRVAVKVVIDESGKIYQSEILSSPHESLSEEVKKTVSQSPEWTPGLQDGAPVKVAMIFPVNFSLAQFDSLARNNGGPYTYAEVMPKFKKSDEFRVFKNWVTKHLNLRNTMVRNQYQTGTVIAAFMVDESGNLGDIEIIESDNDILSEEVIRVLGISPQWIPGENEGEKVKVRYVLPVSFTVR
ncbi:MAG: energy transducer TonB [Rikenellaceae bacterium]|nr:energy transducer TonB [Rikenellaceae bacterium]